MRSCGFIKKQCSQQQRLLPQLLSHNQWCSFCVRKWDILFLSLTQCFVHTFLECRKKRNIVMCVVSRDVVCGVM